MQRLRDLFGLPHEALHLLALILIGRRAVKFTRTHVVIPEDLTLREFIFVAALPGAAAFLMLAAGVLVLLNASTAGAVVSALIAIVVGGVGVAAAFGDFDLIITRIQSGL